MEGTRFVVAEIPGLAAVQVAAVREFMIALLLILVLRYRPKGLFPERHRQYPLPEAK
jgi:branched-chain amino acid transport system permease protein